MEGRHGVPQQGVHLDELGQLERLTAFRDHLVLLGQPARASRLAWERLLMKPIVTTVVWPIRIDATVVNHPQPPETMPAV
ncbi:hypothetical protein CYQ11_00505 [Streptomyces cinnamoneus]|nr:hypothetical protein CYQ11_00505 [Streptomyces cinnamoneus]